MMIIELLAWSSVQTLSYENSIFHNIKLSFLFPQNYVFIGEYQKTYPLGLELQNLSKELNLENCRNKVQSIAPRSGWSPQGSGRPALWF